TDSSIISSPDWNEVCPCLRKMRNKYGMRFFGFVYAEQLTGERADLLKRSGFYAVDIGLQSTNAATLRTVGRNIDHRRFVRGIRLLEKRGIQYAVDVIVGLPGDTLESFKQTLRFVTDNRFQKSVFFKLWVLPGTRLRQEAERYGIRYMKEPPYNILGAPYLSSEEIQEAMLLAKKKQRFEFDGSFSSYCQCSYPGKRKQGRGKTGRDDRFNKVIVHLDCRSQSGEKLRAAAEKLAGKVHQPFTVHFKCENAERDIGLMRAFIGPVADRNPYLVWNVIVESGETFSPSLVKALEESIPARERVDEYPAVSLGGILPAGKGSAEERLEELKGRMSLYVPVTVDRSTGWKEAAVEAFGNAYGKGIVVEVDPGLSLPDVREAVRYLEEEGRKRGREVHYRNLALAYAVATGGQGEALKRHCVVESVAEIDKGMKFHRVITPGAETDLELIRWQMKIGKSRGHVIKPVTYDRPYS
ncbi:MAG: B12-binding domain-containing radical SAM protein, partial [Endomicrobiales bacterium]